MNFYETERLEKKRSYQKIKQAVINSGIDYRALLDYFNDIKTGQATNLEYLQQVDLLDSFIENNRINLKLSGSTDCYGFWLDVLSTNLYDDSVN